MKIVNWVGGSFFRTMGRFLFYALLGGLFGLLLSKLDIDFTNILMEDAHALEYNYDYISNYDVPFRSYIHKSSDLELMTGMVGDLIYNSGATTITNAVITRSYQANKNTTSISNGSDIWITTNVGLRNAGNLYSYQLLICTNKSVMSSVSYEFGFNQWNSYYIPQYTYKTQNWSAADANSSGFIADSSNISNCYLFSGYGVYKSNTTGLSVHFTGTASLSGVRFYIMGFNVDDLGYYKENMLDDIEEIINSNMSGVATKSDIASVNAKIQQTNEAISDVNDSINNSDTSGANSDASGFFNNFQSNDHGLTGIITTPLSLIQSITSATCTSLNLPLPFVNENISLPCMNTIYSQHFGTFYTIYQTITFGIVAYWVCVKVFYKVQDFKNPSNSNVEVLEL